MLPSAFFLNFILSEMAEKLPDQNGGKNTAEESPLMITDKMLEADFDEVYRNYPLNEDTTCGFGFLRGKCLQL